MDDKLEVRALHRTWDHSLRKSCLRLMSQVCRRAAALRWQQLPTANLTRGGAACWRLVAPAAGGDQLRVSFQNCPAHWRPDLTQRDAASSGPRRRRRPAAGRPPAQRPRTAAPTVWRPPSSRCSPALWVYHASAGRGQAFGMGRGQPVGMWDSLLDAMHLHVAPGCSARASEPMAEPNRPTTSM